jgi:hypothetical protein
LDPSGRIERNPLFSTKPLGSKRFSGGSACPRTPFRRPHPATSNAWTWETGSAEDKPSASAAPTPINSSAGELVPITPENALKIKQAVLTWQKDSQRARAELATAQAANASIISLKSRLDACLAEMSAIIAGLLA